MAWGWDNIEQGLENVGSLVYDVTHSSTVQASVDALGKVTGYNKTEDLQAVSTGVAEGTIKSYDTIKTTSKYLFWGVAGLIGLIIYSKLK